MRFMMWLIPGAGAVEGEAPGNGSDADGAAAMARYNHALWQAGVLVALDGLCPPSMGARIFFAGGGAELVDGPRSGTMGVPAGYWMVDVASRDEAIASGVFGPVDDALAVLAELGICQQEMGQLEAARGQPERLAGPSPAAVAAHGGVLDAEARGGEHRAHLGELHQPLGPLPLEYQGAPVPTKMNKLGSGGSPGFGSFLHADPADEGAALTEARHASERRALTALRAR